MQIFEIEQLGAEVLRQKAKRVDEILSCEVQTFIDRLLLTCKEARGMGIAAPQVGKSWRLLVISSHPNERYPNAPTILPTVLINPKVVAHSESMSRDWEGCLSLPGIRAQVARFDWVEIAYTTRENYIKQVRFEGFLARVFQHEYDHLEGKVFIDRVESTIDIVMEKEYQRILRDTH